MAWELIEEEPLDINPSSVKQGTQFLGRTVGRTAARASESLLGLPGDIANLAYQSYKGTFPYANDFGTSASNRLGREAIKQIEKQNIPNVLPTSENIRKYGTKKLTGEFLEPKTSGEEFWDDIVSDATQLLLPVKSKAPFHKSLGKALGKSTIGNLSKWAAQEVTGSPLAGEVAKLGSIALASTAGGRRELNKIKQDDYTKAYKAIGDKSLFNFYPEKSKIDAIYAKFSKGDSPHKEFVLERLDAMRDLLTPNVSKKELVGAYANPKDFINIKQGWNEYLRGSLSNKERDALMQAVGIANEGISRYGARNKKFFEPYRKGEELTAAMNSSNIVQRFLSKHPYLQEKINNPLIQKILLPASAYGISKVNPLVIGGIVASAFTARESARMYQLLSKSPKARKYYGDLIKASLKENSALTARSLSGLNKEADKFDFTLENSDGDWVLED